MDPFRAKYTAVLSLAAALTISPFVLADPQPETPEATTEPGGTPEAAPRKVILLSGAASLRCPELPLGSVLLEGCENNPCGEPEMGEQFLSLVGLEPGEVLTGQSQELVKARLMATGFFRRVVLQCASADSAVDLTVHLTPNSFVRKVSVEGNVYFREREIRKRIFLRAGSVLNATPGRERADETVQRQMDSLKRLYRKEGLEDVRIDVRSTPVVPGVVDVVIEIEEGVRQRIRKLNLIHRRPPKAKDGSDSECPIITHSKLAELVKLQLGQVVTSKDLRAIRKRTEAWFQSVGYVRPEVTVSAEGEPLTLSLEVKTDRCWLLRVWEREAAALDLVDDEPAFRQEDPLNVQGVPRMNDTRFDRVSLEPWRELLPFGESGVFDREEAERGVQAIREVVQGSGLLYADVRMEHRRQARGATPQGGRATGVLGTIDYLITRNFERRVTVIRLQGAQSYPESKLLAEMETQPYDFFASPGHLLVDKVLYDLTRLKRFYRARGFYTFAFGVVGQPTDRVPVRTLKTEGDWSVWEIRFRDRGFRIRKHRMEMSVELEIPFVEGPRTEIERVHFIGNTQMGTITAQEILGLYPGQPYDRSSLEDGLGGIENWYHRRGHHQVSVSLRCETSSEVMTQGLCDPLEVRAAKVELSVHIDEGQKTRVGEILWRGNFKTRPAVLVRDMPKEGEPYNPARVTEAARRLRNLGVFNAVQIDRIGLNEDPPRETLGLVVSVEEAESRFVDMAVGFRTIDREVDKHKKAPPWLGSVLGQETATADRTTTGFGRPFALSLPDILLKLEAEYVDMNFLGLAHRFRVPFRFGFSTNDPVRVLSLTPTFSVPRVFDSSVHMDLKLLAELDEVSEQLDRTEIGASGSFTWPVAPRMTLGASLDAGFIRFRDPDITVASNNPDDLLTGELTPQVRPFLRWRWDTQDNPLNPTKGFALATQVGYILEIDRETIAASGATSLNDFVKWEASAEGAYQTRIGPVLAAFVHYGGSVGDGDTLLPPNERFTLGGTTGMRGFADHSVGRYDRDGKLQPDLTDIEQFGGGNVVINGSLEVRMPVMRQAGVWAGLFMDAGLLSRTHSELHPSGLRASAGIGLRYLIGQQIPLRLDWGFVLGKPRCLEWRADDPGGTCGTTEESSAFHLDLLYPF